MSEIVFLTYSVLLKWMERDFQIMPAPFNLIQFQKNIPFMVKMTKINQTDQQQMEISNTDYK